jgi:hypothetical protein
MKTYVEVSLTSEGEKASVITEKLLEMKLEISFGQHDFVYNWKYKATFSEVLRFIDRVQSKLKGSGVILKFTTID